MGELENWVSSKEVAEYLGINKDTLQRWLTSGKIPGHRIGRLWKFKISEIDAWIANENTAYTKTVDAQLIDVFTSEV